MPAIALLSVALGLVTYSSFQTTLVEQEINGEMTAMFKESEYAEMGLTLEGVTVDYRHVALLLKEPAKVSVLVGRRAGQEVPPDRRADARLTETIGKDIKIRVGFVESQISLP